jgi:hypothetical protein
VVERIEPDFEYEYDLGGPLDEIPGGATTALQGTPLVVIWHLTAQPPQGAVMRSPGPRYEPSNLAKARFNDAVRIARQALTGKTQLTIFGSMQNATYVTPPESDNTWIWQPASFPAFVRPGSLDAGKASAPQAHAAAHRMNQRGLCAWAFFISEHASRLLGATPSCSGSGRQDRRGAELSYTRLSIARGNLWSNRERN